MTPVLLTMQDQQKEQSLLVVAQTIKSRSAFKFIRIQTLARYKFQ